MEQQLLTLQNERKTASEVAAKASDGNNRRSVELERQLAVLRAEMEAMGKDKKTSITQGIPICLLRMTP